MPLRVSHFFAGLCSGCWGESVAIRIAALYNAFSVSRCNGSRNACESSASMGEDRSPPLIAGAPAL